MTAPTLAEWLLEQVAEDERVAERMSRWRHPLRRGDAIAAARRSRGRIEVAARWADLSPMAAGHLAVLSLPYADRPGYREEWRP